MIPVHRRTGVLVIAVALFGFGCAPAETPASPTVAEGLPVEVVLGCISIEAAECAFVSERVVAAAPGERQAFSVLIVLFDCQNAACPRSLAAREGYADVEYPDGGEPVRFALGGPPNAPQIAAQQMLWSGLQFAKSPRAAGPGPIPFDLGHCGLTWRVDFDGSFWVPVGQVLGDQPGIINQERGRMALLGPNLAQYIGPTGLTARLARFPGPKHVWLCD
jgi:hypothetical protein